MAEIKVNCPHCSQHIQCDEGYRGMQIDCPNCQQGILVPAATILSKTKLDLHNESQKLPHEPTPVAFTSIKAYLIALAVVVVFGVFACWGIYALCVRFPDKQDNQPPPQSQQQQKTIPAASNPNPGNLQQSGIAPATDDGEYTAFYNANVLFNQGDYNNAATAYAAFVRNYPSSPRIQIVQQRMADIQRIINSENVNSENAANVAKDEYEEIYQRVISSLPNGESPYPDVFVKGYGSDRLSAFKNAYNSLPADVQKTRGRIHAVEFDGSCCKITFW
jgi:hypothetical protein